MRLCAALAGHHRRGRGDQAHAENRRRHAQVEPKRCRRQLGWPKPPHHHHIGRANQRHRQVGQDQRPRKRQGRAKFIAPRGMTVRRDCRCGHGTRSIAERADLRHPRLRPYCGSAYSAAFATPTKAGRSKRSLIIYPACISATMMPGATSVLGISTIA